MSILERFFLSYLQRFLHCPFQQIPEDSDLFHSSEALEDMLYRLGQGHRALGYEVLYNYRDYTKGIPDIF